MTLRIWLGVLALTLIGGTGAALGEIPGASDISGFTERDYLKAKIEWNRRTVVEVYKQHGHRDPAWDKQAIEALTDLAARFAGVLEGDEDGDGSLRIMKLSTEALDTGCKDPMVYYALARMMDTWSEDPAKIEPYLRQAIERFSDSKYPPFRWASSADVMARLIRERHLPGNAAEYEAKALKWRLAGAHASKWSDADRRLFYHTYLERLDDGGDGESVLRVMAAEKDIDPWQRHLVAGNIYLRMARITRPRNLEGLPPQLAQAMWEQFDKSLAQASEHFTAAWKLEPDMPEGATGMIEATLEANRSTVGDARTWFDRAVKAQFDYPPAYEAMAKALQPEWFGSHRQMAEFGKECLNTGRFDTDVPLFYWTQTKAVHKALGYTNAFWQMPGVLDNAVVMFDGLATDPAHGDDARRYRSQAVIACAIGERWEEARRRCDALGTGKIYSNDFVDFAVLPWFTRNHIYARTSLAAKHFAAMDRLFETGGFSEAGMMARDIIRREPDIDTASRRYAYQIECAGPWLQQFAEGGWVDILPRTNTGGWNQLTGDGETVKGEFKLQASSRWYRLHTGTTLCVADFGNDWEMEGAVHIPADDKGGAGFTVFSLGNGHSHHVVLHPHQKRVYLQSGPNKAHGHTVTLQATNEFRAQMSRGHLTVWVNGERLCTDLRFRCRSRADHGWIGLYGETWHPTQTYTYTKLRIRKLTDANRYTPPEAEGGDEVF